MAMAIERPNSFHLMLSDDELKLLRLLAEQEGLNASDYLRLLMRRAAGGGSPVNIARIRELVQLLAPEIDMTTLWPKPVAVGAPPPTKRAKTRKRKSA